MQMFNNIDLEFILSVFHKILKNKRYLTFILGFFIRFLTKGNVQWDVQPVKKGIQIKNRTPIPRGVQCQSEHAGNLYLISLHPKFQ